MGSRDSESAEFQFFAVVVWFCLCAGVMAAVLRFSPSLSLVSDSSVDGNVVVSCSSSSLVSSLAGEKLRLRTTSLVGCCACGNRTTTVRSAAGGGFQAEKLREVRVLSSLFPSSDDQRAEVSAGAVATTDYGIARGRGGRQFPFGYSQGSDSEEEEEEEDEEAEVLLVDKNVKDPGSQLDIASLGLPQPVVDALAKRGISQLFPIQVTSQYIWKKRGEKIARVGIYRLFLLL